MNQSTPTDEDIQKAERIYSYSSGPGWEYKNADIYTTPSGRFILKEESLHIDSESGPNTYYSWLDKENVDQEIERLTALEQEARSAASDQPPTFSSILGCIVLIIIAGTLVAGLIFLVQEKVERSMNSIEGK